MDIRLIALDLDGTSLDSKREWHPSVVPAVHRAVEKGIQFCLASGRNALSLKVKGDQLGIPYHRISSNGGLIQHAEGLTLAHTALTHSVKELALRIALELDVHLNADGPDFVISRSETLWSDVYRRRAGVDVRVVPLDQFTQYETSKVIYIGKEEELDAVQHALLRDLDPLAGEIVRTEPDYLEILPAGVHKAAGLQVLCDHLGFTAEQVAAIGDYDNDLEMLRWAGVSAAVANANELVKSVASRHFSSNDEGGASEFVDWIVYNGVN